MKLVKSQNTKRFENSKTCTAIEYPLGDKDINGTLIQLEGRYPESGLVVNDVCKEIVYITKGSTQLEVDGELYELHVGDMAFILPGEKYYFEGKAEMFMPCTPAWYPEQHREIDS